MDSFVRPLSDDSASPTGTAALGDGPAGVIVILNRQKSTVVRRMRVQQTALAQMCAHMGSGDQDQLSKLSGSGGLLTGPEPQNGTLLVAAAIPLGVRGRSGASLVSLLAGELAILGAQQEASKTPLGFYRILTVGDNEICADDPNALADLDLALPAFSSFQCCFVMTPLSPSDVSFRVLVRNDTAWEQIQELRVQLTLDPARPRITDSLPQNPGRFPAVEMTSLPPSAAVPHARQPEAHDRTPPRSGRLIRGLVVAAALGVTAIIAIGGAYRWMNDRLLSARRTFQAEPQKTSPPHFSASREGSEWKLTWDAAAVEAMQPTAAILSIQDGSARQEIPLTPADLSSGTIYYSPNTAELAFGIQFLKEGIALAEERIRVLREIQPLDKPLDQPQRPLRQEKDRPPGPASPQVAYSGSNFVPATRRPNTAEAAVRNAVVRTFSPPISREPSRELAAISTTAAPLVVSGVPSVPTVELEPTFAPPPTPSVSVPVSAPVPVNAQVPANVPAPATPPMSAPAPLPTSSPALPPAQTSPVGPKPIKQFQPIASDVAGMHGTVELRVAISAKGKVTKVTKVGGSRNFQLTSAAIKAAEFWEFEPAKLNGQAVPSEMNLIFRF